VGVAASKKKTKKKWNKRSHCTQKNVWFLRHTHTLAQLSLCYFYRLQRLKIKLSQEPEQVFYMSRKPLKMIINY